MTNWRQIGKTIVWSGNKSTGWDISPENHGLDLMRPSFTSPGNDFSRFLTSEGDLVQAKVDR